ncbi:MAG: hypothetical protein IT162_20755 [Bryobacterales bacterium]|nr:hypothetical protein [Bryobacterales bacterium]
MSDESNAPAPSVGKGVAVSGAARSLGLDESRLRTLAARMKQGDQQALSALYDEASPVLYGLLLRMLSDAGAAQEALMETFLRIWRRVHQFDPEACGLAAWMILLARSVALEKHGLAAAPATPLPAPGGDEAAVRLAFFHGVAGGDLRGALQRLRAQHKGGGAQ